LEGERDSATLSSTARKHRVCTSCAGNLRERPKFARTWWPELWECAGGSTSSNRGRFGERAAHGAY